METCSSAQDCSPIEACHPIEKTCVPTCSADADCAQNERCNNTFHVCVSGVLGIPCAGNDDCGDDHVCSPATNQCVEGCLADADCSEGKLCKTNSATVGVCLAPELGGSGNCQAAIPQGQAIPSPLLSLLAAALVRRFIRRAPRKQR